MNVALQLFLNTLIFVELGRKCRIFTTMQTRIGLAAIEEAGAMEASAGLKRLSSSSGLSCLIDAKLSSQAHLKKTLKEEGKVLRKLKARRERLLKRLSGLNQERVSQMNALFHDIQARKDLKEQKPKRADRHGHPKVADTPVSSELDDRPAAMEAFAEKIDGLLAAEDAAAKATPSEANTGAPSTDGENEPMSPAEDDT